MVPGATLGERKQYRVLKEIGKGVYGKVIRALDTEQGVMLPSKSFEGKNCSSIKLNSSSRFCEQCTLTVCECVVSPYRPIL